LTDESVNIEAFTCSTASKVEKKRSQIECTLIKASERESGGTRAAQTKKRTTLNETDFQPEILPFWLSALAITNDRVAKSRALMLSDEDLVSERRVRAGMRVMA
jgi:hypothetical protein